jgi:Cu/Ag efflux pump CusA
VFAVGVGGAPQPRRSPDDVRSLLLDTPAGGQVRLDQVADVRVAPSPDVIEREGAFRRIDVSAQVAGRDRGEVLADVERRLESIQFPLEYRAELLGTYLEGQAAKTRLLWLAGLVVVGMLLLLQACFGSWKLSAAFLVALALALSGSLVAIALGGGDVSIGAAAGLLTVLAVAARNGIVLIRRYLFLRRRESRAFGPELVVEGARERLAPTLVGAAATALVFAPFVVLGELPGYEILRPMAAVVLCGLLTATAVSLFLVPALYLRFGRVEPDSEIDLMMLDDELAEHLAARARETGASPPLAGSGVGSEA